jgi:hypothetical protein
LQDPYSSIPLSEAYLERVIAELGTDIYYEIICEPLYKGTWKDTYTEKQGWPGTVYYWMGRMIEKLWSLGVPAENICYGAELVYEYVPATDTFKGNSLRDIFGQAAEVVRYRLQQQGWTKDAINRKLNAGWQAQHNCGRAPEWLNGKLFSEGIDNRFCIEIWGGVNSQRPVIVSDDANKPHGEPIMVDPLPNGRSPKPSPQEEYTAAKGLLAYPFPKGLAIEVLGYKHNGEIYAQLREVSRAVYEMTGSWPDNYGKFPKPDPVPVPPTPQPEPEPVKEGAPWWSWNRIRNVRRWTWQAWFWLVVLVAVAWLAIAIL